MAVLGHGFDTVVAGQPHIMDGTSAAAPVMAGLLSLVNDARLAQGQPPLGTITVAGTFLKIIFVDSFMQHIISRLRQPVALPAPVGPP